MITPRFLFGLTQKSKTVTDCFLAWKYFLQQILSLNSFWWPRYTAARFGGCKLNFRSGKKLDNIANSGGRPVKLSLGAGSQKSRVSYFGTIITTFIEHFSYKLFHERDNGHQVVLSLLNVFEWNCASKIGAITAHLSPNAVLFSHRNLVPNYRFLDPPNGITSRENWKSLPIFEDIDKLSHPPNFKQLEWCL